ncbi:unnamed protein product [Symbiodinium sp. CCMP2456]|nr:unnamed protein product [Symbiodinium sp. CCMP2456]
MSQSCEKVLGKLQPTAMEDPIPLEFPGSEASEEGPDTDSIGQLVHGCLAFIEQMQAIRPETLRGVRVWKLLCYLPSAWLRGNLKDLHGWSQQTAQFDQFCSHSWQGSRWTKYGNMLYLHNCMPASIAGTLSSSIACGLVSAGYLGVHERWCLPFGIVAFCITLLLWHPQKLVFLDIVCIHQSDQRRKGQALLSMGAFLKQSKSMLVLWDPTWVTRLWCIFEIAAFLHSRSPGRKADLQIVPPLFGPVLLLRVVLTCAICMMYDYVNSSMASSGESMLVGELSLVVLALHLVVFLSFATHALRGYARSVETLQEQLRDFKVEHVRSACCDRGHENNSLICDREVLLQCIAVWYKSLDSFERHVQTEVRMAVIDQLAYNAISYQHILLVSTPWVWLRLGYAASNANDPSRQVVDLAQTLTYFLAIFPLVDKVGFRLCYRLRARCCKPYLDFLLSMVTVIWAFMLYVACHVIQLYAFRENDRRLLLSVISMLTWWTVAAILWRFV